MDRGPWIVWGQGKRTSQTEARNEGALVVLDCGHSFRLLITTSHSFVTTPLTPPWRRLKLSRSTANLRQATVGIDFHWPRLLVAHLFL